MNEKEKALKIYRLQTEIIKLQKQIEDTEKMPTDEQVNNEMLYQQTGRCH